MDSDNLTIIGIIAVVLALLAMIAYGVTIDREFATACVNAGNQYVRGQCLHGHFSE